MRPSVAIWRRITDLLPARHFSSAQRHSPHKSIYVSSSTSPYFNLTLEDWLFRHKSPDEPLLLIYRDEPCVVIGRNQNPWKEVNFEAIRARPGIPWIRRRSGGGTVYHDLGNTNFSIHLPRQTFDRHVTAQIVLRAVRSLGIDARVNERNDICVGPDKVSGSAYKIVNKRAYHHGTMLISTKLDTLGDLLRTDKETMITRGVASVRSPVCNLQQYSNEVTHDTFADAVIAEFRKEYDIREPVHTVEETEDMTNIEYIQKGMEELHSWDWAYGQTPEFSYTLSRTFSGGEMIAEIKSKQGLITSCSLHPPPNFPIHEDILTTLGAGMVGARYGFVTDAMLPPAAKLSDLKHMDLVKRIRQWLVDAMRT